MISEIVYEQPISEHMRVCLRLELLFQQAKYRLQAGSVWDSRAAITTLIDILNLLDRPDLKTKLTKELCRYLSILGRLEKTTDVDHQKLSALLVELENVIDALQAMQGKFGQDLRDSDFLSSIRQHQANPGGISEFDSPSYCLWLKQSIQQHHQDLENWFREFESIQVAINIILKIVRNSASPENQIAKDGFFQAVMDANAGCQLIRVAIPHPSKLFPEISVGRHGVCVRFFQLNLKERPKQVSEDVSFKLTSCVF
jgi:cell division protein ZapD